MKQKSGGIKRLMEFTGKHRGLLTVSRILSGISSVFILGPFLCVYFAARDAVRHEQPCPLGPACPGTGIDRSGPLLFGAALLSCSGISHGENPKDGSVETFGEDADGVL